MAGSRKKFGRPRRIADELLSQLTIRLSTADKAKLRDIATLHSCSLSEACCVAIDKAHQTITPQQHDAIEIIRSCAQVSP